MNQYKVLVAETNPLVGDNLRAVLQKFGLVCKLLHSHQELLPALTEQSWDIIFMDSDTIDVNYADIIKELKSLNGQSKKDLPVLALTSQIEEDNVKTINDNGFDDYVIKPLDLSDLKAKLSKNIPSFIPIWEEEAEGPGTVEDLEYSAHNLSYLVEYAGGDMDFVNELVRYFIDETPKAIVGLKNAHQKGNWDDLRMIAHKYNPQMSVMGLDNCALILATIENNARNGVDLQDIPNHIHQLEIHCKAAIESLGKELERKKEKALRVLVCEDDLMMLKLIEHKMLKAGYEIVVAKDGKVASEFILKEEFNLIITDLLMPYMSGLELITLLRTKLNKNTPIIVLSRIGLENTVLKAFELGADDYIVKPFSPNELLIRAKKLVSK